jgi:tetratricopeptide (TPR) repeat protein
MARDDGERLRALTAELRAANYAADAGAVGRLLAQLRALAADATRTDRAMAHYQAGTASGLLAGFVGPGSLANPEGDVPLMLRHLREAAADLEAAVALDPDLADAHAALANNYGYRAFLEPERAAELSGKSKAARQRSLALAPRNPRVVTGHAGFLFWAPSQAGGDRPRGLARYQEALELYAAEPAAERDLHVWGEPDTWAFLSFSYLALDPPDPAAAKRAAERAIALRPDFAWVRGALLPRIEQAAATVSSPRGDAP